jgi:hypothetical protein
MDKYYPVKITLDEIDQRFPLHGQKKLDPYSDYWLLSKKEKHVYKLICTDVNTWRLIPMSRLSGKPVKYTEMREGRNLLDMLLDIYDIYTVPPDTGGTDDLEGHMQHRKAKKELALYMMELAIKKLEKYNPAYIDL